MKKWPPADHLIKYGLEGSLEEQRYSDSEIIETGGPLTWEIQKLGNTLHLTCPDTKNGGVATPLTMNANGDIMADGIDGDSTPYTVFIPRAALEAFLREATKQGAT